MRGVKAIAFCCILTLGIRVSLHGQNADSTTVKLSESPGESYLLMRTEGLVFFKSVDKKTLQCTWMDTAFKIKKTFMLASLISSKVEVSLYDKVLHKFNILVRKGDKVQLVKCDPETENNEVYVFNFPKSIQHLKMTSTQTSLWILGEEKNGVLRAYNFNYANNKIQKINLAIDGLDVQIRSLQVLENSKLALIYSYLKKKKSKRYYDILLWNENCVKVTDALLSELNDKHQDTMVMLDIQTLGENEYFVSGQVTSPPYAGFDNFICRIRDGKELYYKRFTDPSINKHLTKSRPNAPSMIPNEAVPVANVEKQIYTFAMPLHNNMDTIVMGNLLYTLDIVILSNNHGFSDPKMRDDYWENRGYNIHGGVCYTFGPDGKLLHKSDFHADVLSVKSMGDLDLNVFYIKNWYAITEFVYNRRNIAYIHNDSVYYSFTEFYKRSEYIKDLPKMTYENRYWYNNIYLLIGKHEKEKKTPPLKDITLSKVPLQFWIK